ncbi:MAG: hypothetical protein IMY86_13715 [Chloroflexi bacterium]|nr:hypothetical protein [Chloroflexota bacterium]
MIVTLPRGQRVNVLSLDCRVLAVAVFDPCGDWAAYIGAVPGHEHDAEWMEVMKTGTKLPREVAVVLYADTLKAMNEGREWPYEWRG